MNHAALEELEGLARKIRIRSLAAIFHAGSGHPGGSLSAAELLAYLWAHELDEAGRNAGNRFILSKGHACPALYAAVAGSGLIPEGQLRTLRKLGSPLQGHPHVLDAPWAETSTGSLGQGFSVAIGIALGFRHQKAPGRVFVMLGDGELQEGEVWEGAMFAGHYKLDNLCGIIDYNTMQSDDVNDNIMNLEPLRSKWEAFNWNAVEIDGHSFEQIEGALDSAAGTSGIPTMIIAHTLKGKGVSFMEGSPLWHGSVKLRQEELERSLSDLGVSKTDIGRYVDGSIWG